MFETIERPPVALPEAKESEKKEESLDQILKLLRSKNESGTFADLGTEEIAEINHELNAHPEYLRNEELQKNVALRLQYHIQRSEMNEDRKIEVHFLDTLFKQTVAARGEDKL